MHHHMHFDGSHGFCDTGGTGYGGVLHRKRERSGTGHLDEPRDVGDKRERNGGTGHFA